MANVKRRTAASLERRDAKDQPDELDQIARCNGQPFPSSWGDLVTRYGLPYFDGGKVFDVDWRKADGTPLTAEEIENTNTASGMATFSGVPSLTSITYLVHTFAAGEKP